MGVAHAHHHHAVVAATLQQPIGVHLGHARLIHRAREAVGEMLGGGAGAAAGAGGRVVALAFDPHPLTVLRPEAAPPRLSRFEQRVSWLLDAGADEVRRLRPTGDFLSQSPEAFVEAIVAEHRPDFIVEGSDFQFGRARAGSVATLRELESRLGYRTIEVETVTAALANQQTVDVSSTITRWLVERGRMRDVAVVLDRPYELNGTIVSGDRRGRDLGIPTANLDAEDLALPADGIYAGRARRLATGDEPLSWYPAAVSVGTKPTFGECPRTCEAHLLGYDGPLDDYGWTISLQVTDWIRDQVRCPDETSLVAQIRRDIAQVEILTRRVPRRVPAVIEDA